MNGNLHPLFLLVPLFLLNANAFLMMYSDKRRSIKGAWRVPEKRLFLSALLFGGIGATFGMWTFRHKTRHWYFRFGFPAIALVQIGLCAYLVISFVKI